MAIDTIIAAIDTKLDREVTAFTSDFDNVLSEVERLLLASTLTADPLSFDLEFSMILDEAGYYTLVNHYIDDSYDQNYTELLALFKESGLDVTFTPDDLLIIQNIKELDTQLFLDIGVAAGHKLKSDIYKYKLTGLSRREMLANISESLKDTDLAKYSATYANTAISNFNQSVLDMKTSDMEGEVYIYRGVSDGDTRKFCKCVLDQKKFYNRANASSLRSDKRRQWNCRHLVVPMFRSAAEDLGLTEGTFSC